MQALKVLVVVMGVLIVAMLATVVVTILHRASHPAPPALPVLAALVALNEPAGTHIGTISPVGDHLAVLLEGGGPDRLVFLDAAGHIAARVSVSK